MKTPQINPPWKTGIWNGVAVMTPKTFTADDIRDMFDEDLNITFSDVERMTGWSRDAIKKALMNESVELHND
tara:strand:- start:533 stop:748 length:216 start_codon:yes stop_codon:yes gene_type:complete